MASESGDESLSVCAVASFGNDTTRVSNSSPVTQQDKSCRRAAMQHLRCSTEQKSDRWMPLCLWRQRIGVPWEHRHNDSIDYSLTVYTQVVRIDERLTFTLVSNLYMPSLDHEDLGATPMRPL
jgi:hypothetical protein